MRLSSMVALVALATTRLAVAAEGGEPGAPDAWCWDVKGSLQASFTAEGCTSVLDMCTQGTLSTSGFLQGATYYTADGAGGGLVGEPSIVWPAVEAASTWAYAGELVVTSSLGTVTFHDVGLLDTANGGVTEIDRAVDGSGLYQGVSGTLFMFGFTYPDGSGFEVDVEGRLCLPTTAPGIARNHLAALEPPAR